MRIFNQTFILLWWRKLVSIRKHSECYQMIEPLGAMVLTWKPSQLLIRLLYLFTLRKMREFIEGFWTGFVIVALFACVGAYAYGMYYLITNGYYWWFVIVACLTFCIGCGIRNMDGPFDDLLPY